ncbi:MAG: D-inositol-3-phosphate glycosyltransferase, partial [Nocardioides sp.]
LLVPSHDPQEWAAALGRVVGDDALRAKLARGAVEQAAQFSWSRTAERTLAVYEQARALMAVEALR